MHKKHIFLSIFSKITIFACVFCTLSALADTTTCDIDFTPVTGNSWQNGTPTPTAPVEIESVGTKVGNKYAVQVAINNGGGVVDMGTLNWIQIGTNRFYADMPRDCLIYRQDSGATIDIIYETVLPLTTSVATQQVVGLCLWHNNGQNVVQVRACDNIHTTANDFKAAMSGKLLYYQRATDETWTAPTLKTVYLDEPLRKVGDYADVLDYKNGTITRNVGVKVFTGTENWILSTVAGTNSVFYTVQQNMNYNANVACFCTHYKGELPSVSASSQTDKTAKAGYTGSQAGHTRLYVKDTGFLTAKDFANYLADQYAAGTPVTVYYPLATPVVEQIENWSCPVPITDIQIATTKMVDEEFAAAEANLAATVQTIESVVSRTITQTGQIATLQAEKQTRPDETCPANMKCLLVQDEDGTPHWYPIIEP